jgi:hypothetical protein
MEKAASGSSGSREMLPLKDSCLAGCQMTDWTWLGTVGMEGPWDGAIKSTIIIPAKPAVAW